MLITVAEAHRLLGPRLRSASRAYGCTAPRDTPEIALNLIDNGVLVYADAFLRKLRKHRLCKFSILAWKDPARIEYDDVCAQTAVRLRNLKPGCAAANNDQTVHWIDVFED